MKPVARPLTDIARVRSAVPEIVWPALPEPADAVLLALLYQFERSQWWLRATLLKHQLEQVEALLEHARATVPFYRERLPQFSGRLTLAGLREIPLLTRRDVQRAGPALHSRTLPPGHEPASPVETSGSTGTPVRTLTTNITRAMMIAMNTRNLLWHGFDFSAKVALIRRFDPGVSQPTGSTPGGIFESGAALRLDVGTPIPDQVASLSRERPAYVLSYPTVLDAIARHCGEYGVDLSFVERLLSYGEVLDPAVRERCRRSIGAPIIDCYSSVECGMLALQCPGGESYHVMSEGVLLEVLDKAGRPSRSGTVGRVVVTVLHNFAAPLIRYEIGDYAEVGKPCACGRGLPVLNRILGRVSNLLCLPGGVRRWPFPHRKPFAALDPLRQCQIVQKSLDTLEVRLALSRPFSPDERARFERLLLEAVEHPFRIEYRFMDAIPRSASGKFEDFLCEVADGDIG